MSIRDDNFWASFLGVDSADWETSGALVRPHAGLHGYRGFWCFRRNQRIVVSAPASWVPRLTEILLQRVHDEDLLRPAFWIQVLPDDVERHIGPAFQGSLEPGTFICSPNSSVRPVDAADDIAIQDFRAACGPDWNDSGLDNAQHWRHAFFRDGRILAMAGFRPWLEDAGDPCVLTRSDARSQGCGAAVTAAVVHAAQAEGKLLLYQTLESNLPAVRLAFSLGYTRYANHLAVRLNRDAPHL